MDDKAYGQIIKIINAFRDLWYIDLSDSKENIISKFKSNIKSLHYPNNVVSWPLISCYVPLCEEFVREFQEELDWADLFMWQKFSEPFIREFIYKVKNGVDWKSIYGHNLSSKFLEDFKEELMPYIKNELNQFLDQ